MLILIDYRNERMVGNLRVPLCFLTRRPYSWDTTPKFDLFTYEKIKKNYSVRLFNCFVLSLQMRL